MRKFPSGNKIFIFLKGKNRRISFLTFADTMEIFSCLPHTEMDKFQLKASFLSLRCYSQVEATHVSQDNCCLAPYGPLGGKDALITYSRYITSNQLFA